MIVLRTTIFVFLVEDKNFALFNYVNELNNQSELLQEQISDIKKDIQQFEEQGIELEEQRKQILEQMERKRSQALALAKEYEEKSRATKKILDQCRAGKNRSSSTLITMCNVHLRYSIVIQENWL